jgi:hypothetical protein
MEKFYDCKSGKILQKLEQEYQAKEEYNEKGTSW